MLFFVVFNIVDVVQEKNKPVEPPAPKEEELEEDVEEDNENNSNDLIQIDPGIVEYFNFLFLKTLLKLPVLFPTQICYYFS